MQDNHTKMWLPDYLRTKPTFGLSFANYSEMIAYLDGEGMIWVADLLDKAPVQVYQYSEFPNEPPSLVWSPDDRRLFIDNQAMGEVDYMYDLPTQKLITWDYTCDQIAKSPVSGRLVIWCQTNTGTAYAVLD